MMIRIWRINDKLRFEYLSSDVLLNPEEKPTWTEKESEAIKIENIYAEQTLKILRDAHGIHKPHKSRIIMDQPPEPIVPEEEKRTHRKSIWYQE